MNQSKNRALPYDLHYYLCMLQFNQTSRHRQSRHYHSPAIKNVLRLSEHTMENLIECCHITRNKSVLYIVY